MARLRSAPMTQQPPSSTTSTTTQKPRPPLKEKTNTVPRKIPTYEDDGNTEDLVKDARPRRGRARAAPQQEGDFVMAGGLGLASSDDKTSERSAPPSTTDELAKSDGPPLRSANAIRKPPPRTKRKIVQNEAQNKVLEGVKQRMQATARGQTAKAAPAQKQNMSAATKDVAPSSDSLPSEPPPPRSNAVIDRSEYSLSPSPPPPGKLHSAGKQRSSTGQPGSALKSHGTPAAESSILALKNFKRRPRQPSMLQMVQQRTASARPSAVHAPPIEDPSVFDVDDDEDEEDDAEFAPEAESTPLQVSKKPNAGVGNSQTSQHRQPPVDSATELVRSATGSKKRKLDDVNQSSSALNASKSKRRKSTVEDVADDRLDSFRMTEHIPSATSARGTSPQLEIDSEIQVINSQPSSTPPTDPSSPIQKRIDVDEEVAVPSTEPQQGQDDIDIVPLDDLEDDRGNGAPNATMAEPASSSPPAAATVATQRTDIMADPLTQVSPPRAKQRDKPTKKKKSRPMTTATLQSLLPKRRQPLKPRHRKSEYDIDSASEDDSPLDSSHLDDDEDELGGRLRRQTKATTKTKSRKSKPAAAKAKSRQSKAATQTARKSSAASPSRKSTAAKKPSKTYGRTAGKTSDKENNGGGGVFEDLDENDESALPDMSMSMYEAVQSKELEAAKKKFAAIDDWDMEFESMSYEEHRSSSQGWR